MAGRKKSLEYVKGINTDWHIRARKLFEDKLTDRLFFDELAFLRGLSNDEIEDGVVKLILQYNLDMRMHPMICNYVVTGQVNPFFMAYPMTMVSTKAGIAAPSIALNDGRLLKQFIDHRMNEPGNNFVYLIVDPETLQKDAHEWIDAWWTKLVQPQLNELKATTRVRSRTRDFSKRNADIDNHINIEHLPAKTIADKYNITPEYARAIALKQRR